MEQRAESASDTRELVLAIEETLRRLEIPSSATAVRKALPKPYRRPVAAIAATLSDLAAARRAFLLANGRYVANEPAPVVARTIQSALRERPLGEKDLKAAVKRAAPGLEPLTRSVLNSLVSDGVVRQHPKVGKLTKRFGLTPPDPGPYLANALKELRKTLAQLAAHGVTADALHAALGRELGVASARAAGLAPEGADADSVLGALHELAERERPGALLSIRALRAQCALDKTRFDRAVLGLSVARRVVLHHHDFPAGLSPDERAALVEDADGTHYVGITLGGRA